MLEEVRSQLRNQVFGPEHLIPRPRPGFPHMVVVLERGRQSRTVVKGWFRAGSGILAADSVSGFRDFKK